MERLEMIVKIECPRFQSGKEKRRYVKSLIVEIDKQFNKHTVDFGDWPLAIQVIEDEPIPNFLSLRFAKALEPDEKPLNTMNMIIAYMKSDLHLKINDIKRSG